MTFRNYATSDQVILHASQDWLSAEFKPSELPIPLPIGMAKGRSEDWRAQHRNSFQYLPVQMRTEIIARVVALLRGQKPQTLGDDAAIERLKEITKDHSDLFEQESMDDAIERFRQVNEWSDKVEAQELRTLRLETLRNERRKASKTTRKK